MPTLICVPIFVQDEPQAAADALAARDSGADLVEFRIDGFFTGAQGPQGALDELQVKAILRLVAQSPLPCIVTCRAAAEAGSGGLNSGGVGGYTDDEMARVSLYERLGTASSASETRGHAADAGTLREHPPRYLDFEYASYTRSANIKQKINLAVTHPAQVRSDVSTGLILSTHDFEGRPADLTRRVLRMQAEPAASVVKFAFRARSQRDNLEVFDLLRDNRDSGGKPMIGLAMGEFGLMSRVLAPKFGGFLTFASLRRAGATAPGQPTVRDLLDGYRFRSIRPSTKVFGVVGWPVSQSLGPLVHNAGFEAIGFDGVYLPIPIAIDEHDAEKTYLSFKATLSVLVEHPHLDLSGLSVTMPFKEHLVRWYRERSGHSETLDEATTAIGAANTLAIHPDRSTSLTNTDVHAVQRLLLKAFGGENLANRTIVVLGAGGAGRAAAWACLTLGATVLIANRTLARAEKLAGELNAAHGRKNSGKAAPVAMTDLPVQSSVHGIINCTPMGMSGHAAQKADVIQLEEIAGLADDAVIFETVYRPLETPLLRKAKELGQTKPLRIIDGVSMFVEQAAAQFQGWTDHPATVQLFDRISREALSV